ncbi:MAG: NAD-dependent epimerase/dehydratase family protein [Alphaproteobacteria bacterium]|nr:NAD-dependent epimerase/dehydratase family protein [Alphaproteobacteria bacterium]
MRVLITGVDGYLGWPLAHALARRGHLVAGIDALLRREWVAEMGSQSATPILDIDSRLTVFREVHGEDLRFVPGNVCNYDLVEEAIRDFMPDCVVHLGQMPSAPYSMIDAHHAVFTHQNNIVGTLNLLFALRDLAPNAHLVKLGTMGEYGTPNIDIPEGFFDIEYRGRRDRLPFPRQPNSMYHLTKVHDSANIHFACRVWGLTCTDVMQGVVFGTRIDALNGDDRLLTRFDVDQAFGTVINRFCAQAVIGMALSPYGRGHQRRGFLSLRDSIQCLALIIENPPDGAGEYRILNQFHETFDVYDLALVVQGTARDMGIDVEIKTVENPRIEAERHYYNPDHQKLFDLGYRPTRTVREEIRETLEDLGRFAERIRLCRGAILPSIRWRERKPRPSPVGGF